MKKTPVDLQKRFPINQTYSKYLASSHCDLAFPQNDLASLQDHDKVEIMPVDWERGIVHCVLTHSVGLQISRVVQTIDFIQ